MQDGRIDRLTMTDAYRRYLLRCQVVEKTNTERVWAILKRGSISMGCRGRSAPHPLH